MENKKFHKKNYFSFSSIPTFIISMGKPKNTFVKKFNQNILKKKPKTREKKGKIQKPNRNENLSKYQTLNVQKDTFDSSIEKNYNNTIYYSKESLHPFTKTSNSVSKTNHLNRFTYFSSGINFTPNKILNLKKKFTLFEKTEIRPTNYQRHIKISTSNENRINTFKNKIGNDIKTNLYKKFQLDQKVANTIENKSIKIIKFKNEKIKMNKKILQDDFKKINGVESKQKRLRNLLQGISYIKLKKQCELCHKLVDNYIYKFHYNSHPSQILNWMFLGTFKNASNLEEIQLFNFKYILNCAFEIKDIKIPKSIKYCHIDLTDSETIDITQYFDQAFNFIETARKKKEKILIHCKFGISRSASIIIGYFIKYKGYTTSSALEFLKSKRPIVNPNRGFLSQLYSYEYNIKIMRKR